MRIAFLGLGKMGTAIVTHLLAQHTVTVWNRSPQAAEALARLGATAAASPAQAVKDAELVFTMLMDDAAHQEVLLNQGALADMPRGAVLLTLSTISVAFAETLAKETATVGVAYVGCPVFGRPNVAEQGKLYLVVAGAAAAIERARPALTSFSRGMQTVSEHPPAAHAFKLSGNFLIAAVIASLAEAAHAAASQQIDPELFLSTINEALFQSPFYEAYAKVLIHPSSQPGATLALGEKDVRLFREASADRGQKTPLAQVLGTLFERGIEQGRKDEDWASAWYAMSSTPS